MHMKLYSIVRCVETHFPGSSNDLGFITKPSICSLSTNIFMSRTPTQQNNADICSKNVKNSNIVTLYHPDQITKRNYNAHKRTVGETKQCASFPSGLSEWTSIDQLIRIRSSLSLMFRQTEHHIFLHRRTLYFCLSRIKVLKNRG